MGKIITSPVARWAGTITLKAYLNYAERIRYEDARQAAQDLEKPIEGKPGFVNIPVAKYNATYLPGLFAAIERCDIPALPDLSAETFPATPNAAAAELFDWLRGEVASLLAGDLDDPKLDGSASMS
jgi:hypothetical protein